MGHIVALTGRRALPDKLCSEHAFRDDADHFKTSVLDNFSTPRAPAGQAELAGRGNDSHDPKVARRAPTLGRCCTDVTGFFRVAAGDRPPPGSDAQTGLEFRHLAAQ